MINIWWKMIKYHEVSDDVLIDSSRISVIIQGLTHHVIGDKSCLFYRCVNSIKYYLPNAEIIVSTWKGQSCDESVVDKVIYNDEPESIKTLHVKAWNYNKMMVSTYQGLLNVEREYALKFRADLLLEGLNFFYIKPKKNLNKKLLKYKLLKQPINVTNLYIKKPAPYAYSLFHLSDIVQFGLRDDLLNLWNNKCFTKEDILVSRKWWSGFYYPILNNERMVPEQALMTSWINREGFSVDLPYPAYIDFKYLMLSEKLLSINFNVFNWDCVDIKYPKRFTENREFLDKFLYSSTEINFLYLKYLNVFFVMKRYLIVVYYKYFQHFLNIESWVGFIAIFIYCISPDYFLKTRFWWRKLLGKKDNVV